MSEPVEIERRRLGGFEVALRHSDGDGVPVVFCHGNPSHSIDWVPFMARLERPAVALDMPGFGESERPPRERLDGSMHALSDWLGTALDELGIERFRLAVHDWGGLALHMAAQRPERLERLAVINAVPLLAGYRWHWVARLWRRRGVGEALMATVTRPGFGLVLRQARPGFRPMPEPWIDEVWPCFDRGMRAAVLRLYRSADPDQLEAAGSRIGRLDCPALVVWGAEDPYLGPELGRAYAERLPAAELLEVAGAGHWPWLDRPQLLDRVCEFLERG